MNKKTITKSEQIEQIEHFQTHVHTFCLLMPAGDFSPLYVVQFKSPEHKLHLGLSPVAGVKNEPNAGK